MVKKNESSFETSTLLADLINFILKNKINIGVTFLSFERLTFVQLMNIHFNDMFLSLLNK